LETITNRLEGGLGNMLFQIATGYATSLRDNKEFICDTNQISSNHGEYTDYLNNIFRKIKFFTDIKYDIMYGEMFFPYSEIPKLIGNSLIYGYFQSEKYFKNYRDDILKLFEIDDNTNFFLKEKYSDLLKSKTCSLHVRRGDYGHQEDYHPILSLEYYKNAISHFDEDTQFLIFSNEIDWCKNNFDFIKNKTYICDNNNYQDLYLMSMCNHNIIANSSFSWWGAWLNKNENKTVISPKLWFGPTLGGYNTNDLYCENWIKIK